MATINRSVADTNQFSFLRASALRALIAVALAVGAAGVAEAQTTAPAAAPLRISIEVEPGSGIPMHDSTARSIVTGVKNGLRRGMPRGSAKVVGRDDPSDLLVKVSMRTKTLPPLKSQDAPRVALVALSTVVDGRELVSPLSQWEFIGEALGRDVAAILQLRWAGVSSTASDAAQLDVLIQGLASRYALERGRTAARVAALGPAGIKATSALVELLGDDRLLRVVGPGTQTTVAGEAAKALISIGASSALVDVLKSHRDDKARTAALWALARTYRADRSELIVTALADPAASVRRAAVYLARQAGPKAIPRLIEILVQKNDGATRNVARDALVSLSGQNFGLDGSKWGAWLATAKDKK